MTDNDDDDALAAFTRNLFGRPDTDAEDGQDDGRPANHVPREGNNPTPVAGEDLRTFTAELFDRAQH